MDCQADTAIEIKKKKRSGQSQDPCACMDTFLKDSSGSVTGFSIPFQSGGLLQQIASMSQVLSESIKGVCASSWYTAFLMKEGSHPCSTTLGMHLMVVHALCVLREFKLLWDEP